MNSPYSAALDVWLLEAMARGAFRKINNYHAEICGQRMWIENYPYASFVVGGTRPARATIAMAMDRLIADTLPPLPDGQVISVAFRKAK